MSVNQQNFIPPAPPVHAKDLPLWRLMPKFIQSSLSIWPDYSFDVMYSRRKALGVEALLVNDPEGIRHVLSSGAANYRRPMPIIRVVPPADRFRHISGRRRRVAASAQGARPGLHARRRKHPHSAFSWRGAAFLLSAIGGQSQVNLSSAFQDTALEAVLRALFSKPESEFRDRLAGLIRSYTSGPGRPAMLDGFVKREGSFAFFSRGRRRFQAEWLGAIEAVVAERKANRTAGAARDLLDQLLDLKDAETGEGLSNEDIRDQCGTMFFGGSETTARLMFWACISAGAGQGHADEAARRDQRLCAGAGADHRRPAQLAAAAQCPARSHAPLPARPAPHARRNRN